MGRSVPTSSSGSSRDAQLLGGPDDAWRVAVLAPEPTLLLGEADGDRKRRDARDCVARRHGNACSGRAEPGTGRHGQGGGEQDEVMVEQRLLENEEHR